MQAYPSLETIFHFKTKPCKNSHPLADNASCPFSHGETDFRRSPIKINSPNLSYVGILYIPDIMPASQQFFFCQNLFEYNYHISNYKTKKCPYLMIVDNCELGKYCPYIHPGDNLDEINKFRLSLHSPPALFYSPISGIIDSANGNILRSSEALANGKKKSKHILVLPDGEEAYILGHFLIF